MENRYLFRAKTMCIVDIYNSGKKDGEWVSGSLRCDCGKYTIFQFELDIADYTEYEVDPSTICQCTGLKDKNGKLIWENDIANVENDKRTFCIKWNANIPSFIREYKDCMGLMILYLDNFITERMEVIGNKFDNPELLEVQG